MRIRTLAKFNIIKSIIYHRESYLFTSKLISQYIVPVEINLKLKGTPGRNTHITKSYVRIIKVKIIVKDKVVDAESEFDVPLTDHDIKIPKIVNQKIASVISVQFKANLKP